MDKITLDVTEGVYKTAKEARQAGRIPMAYYGKGQENRGFSVDYQDFRRAYEKGGRSTIMYFKSEKDAEFPIIVQDIQYSPATDDIIHVDVMAIDVKETMRTQIPITFTGVAPAVKDLGGILVHNKDKIEVECLPNDLISAVEVDISPLVDFNTSITVGDIKVPDSIKILDAEDINLVIVSAPRSVVEESTTESEDAEEKEGEENAESEKSEASN